MSLVQGFLLKPGTLLLKTRPARLTKTGDINPGHIIKLAIGARARARAMRLYWSLLAKERSLLL